MKSLIPWRRDGGLFETLHREMDEWAERFFGTALEDRGPAVAPPWAPRIDLEETDKELLVKADLPGVDPKDVEVSVTNGVLVLRGERKEAREDRKKNYHRLERFVGRFYREVLLPPGADTDKIVAAGHKGVITITVPKKPEVLAKKVTVKNLD